MGFGVLILWGNNVFEQALGVGSFDDVIRPQAHCSNGKTLPLM